MVYARNDAHYLEPLAAKLRAELGAKGRLEWHAQMCEQLIHEASQPPTNNHDDAWRIKNADRLSRQGMAILRELWHWRDREAVAANRPPFFVLTHDALFGLATALANGESPDGFIPRRYSPRRRERLERAIEQARVVPESDWPAPRKIRGRRLTTAQKQQLERLRLGRDRAAAHLEIDPTLIASRSTLVVLAAGGPNAEAGLLPWQRALLKLA